MINFVLIGSRLSCLLQLALKEPVDGSSWPSPIPLWSGTGVGAGEACRLLRALLLTPGWQ